MTHIDTSSFALKTNLANLKSEVDKLDVDKLKPIPTDLSKLSDVVKNDVVKKTDYNKVVTKVDNVDTSDLVKKTDYNKKVTENKIPDASSFVKKTDYNTKITDTSNLATKTALTTVENKIPDTSNLPTKTALTTSYFDEGSGKQNYLVFLPMRKYFKLNSVVGVTDYVLSWQSKGLSNESIKPPATSNNSLNPRLSYYGTKVRVQFTKSCLKQSKHIFTHKKIVNIYIVYELAASSSHTSNPTIKNCLFGAVTLKKMLTLKNANILVMVLDLIEDQVFHFKEVFHFQVVDFVKMY